MSPALLDRVQVEIRRDEQAIAELFQLAEQAKAQKDQEQYWALTAPTKLGDLYMLARDHQAAARHYERHASYWRSFRAWATSRGIQQPPSYAEACDYLMAGQLDAARTTLLALVDQVGETRADLLGIPLICAGASAEGKALLQRRRIRLQQQAPQDASALYQQGEVLFWLGDLAQARTAAEIAVERWPEPRVRPSVLAMRALFVALTQPSQPDLVAVARTALDTTAEWFYDQGFLSQAVDACEYQRLLDQQVSGQQPIVKLRGLTTLWT